MSIGEVQARIGEIHAMMLTASTAGTTAPAGTAATRTAAGATSAAAPTDFASALQAAMAAAAPNGAATAGATTPGATTPGGWVLPASGQVSSDYGPRWGTQHEGIDIAAGSGTPVRAASDGVVRKASWYGGYGNAVIIDHGGGVRTLYGHNSQLNVQPGERVTAGQVIAKVGSTGDSTGPHLHFEVEVDGKKVDPRPWLAKRGVSL